MDNPYIIAAIASVVGCIIGFFLDRMRMGTAYRTRDELLKDAEREAENLKRTREIEAKEEFLKRREQLESELDQVRDKLRNQERDVDKREARLDELEGNLKKREKMVEQSQTRLADRGKVIENREAELDRIIQEEQEELYKISGLSKEEAL